MKMVTVSEDALNSIKAMAQQLQDDAARYRWLRDQTWYENKGVCVVTLPKQNVKLGAFCPSGDLLDVAIDEVMKRDAT